MAHRPARMPPGPRGGRPLGRPAHGGGAPAVTQLPDPATFLSGEHGEVGGKRGLARRAADAALDRRLRTTGVLRRIDKAAAQLPARDVLVASIYRPPREAPRLV